MSQRREAAYEVEDDGVEEDPSLSRNRFTEGRLRRFCTPPWFMAVLCLFTAVQNIVVTGRACHCPPPPPALAARLRATLNALLTPPPRATVTASTLTSIERRYGIRTSTIGLILSMYDLSVLVVVVFVSFYGGRRHVPRVLGLSCFVLSFGALAYASPHFFGGKYNTAPPSNSDFCSFEALATCSASSTSGLVALFFFGQFFIGLGAAALYGISPSYLDRIVPKERLPVYLAWFYAIASLSAALGFVMASSLLKVWVDPGDQPDGVEPEDAEWVGAWWVGYVACSALLLVSGALFYLFPHYLPNTAHVRAENRRQTRVLERRILSGGDIRADAGADDDRADAAEAGDGARMSSSSSSAALAGGKRDGQEEEAAAAAAVEEEDGLAADGLGGHPSLGDSLRSLLRNPAFLFTCLGQSTESFVVTGMANYLVAAMESLFALSAANAALYFGLVAVPGAAGGTALGGYLVKRLRLTAVETARATWMIALVAFFAMFFFVIGCPTVELAGVTTAYAGGPALGASNNLTAVCNAGCTDFCDPDVFRPVCGDDGVNYFSACYAGCDARAPGVERNDLDAVYENCACIGDGTASAKRGKCDTGCSMLLPFLFFLFLAMVLTFLNTAPASVCFLRTVPFRFRTVGNGVQNVIFRVFGTIPAPIVFGFFLERACIFFATDCESERGNCWVYDTGKLRATLLTLALAGKFMSFVFFFLSWWFFRGAGQFDVVDAHDLPEKGAEDGRRSPSVVSSNGGGGDDGDGDGDAVEMEERGD